MGFVTNADCQQAVDTAKLRNRCSRTMARLSLILISLCALACTKHDEEATPSATDGDLLLALGAFHKLEVGDACRGGGKLNFCSSERVSAFENVTSSDVSVVEVLRHAEFPPSLARASSDFAVRAAARGKTTLVVDARFDDGSLRQTEFEISVAAPDAIDVAVGCGAADPSDRRLLPIAAKSRLSLTLRRGRQELAGVALDALRGDGLSALAGSLERTEYTLIAPAQAGDLTLDSGVLPGWSLSFRIFGFDDVTIAGLDSPLPKPLRFAKGVPVALIADMRIGDKKPCSVLPLQATSASPDVCVGPQGESTWSEPTPGAMRITPVSSGTCRLSVSVSGATQAHDFSVEYEVTAP